MDLCFFNPALVLTRRVWIYSSGGFELRLRNTFHPYKKAVVHKGNSQYAYSFASMALVARVLSSSFDSGWREDRVDILVALLQQGFKHCTSTKGNMSIVNGCID